MIAKLISLERRIRAKDYHKAASALTTQRNSCAHIVSLVDYLHRNLGEASKPSIHHIGRYLLRHSGSDFPDDLDKSIGHRFSRNLVSDTVEDQGEELRLLAGQFDHDVAEHGVLSWRKEESPTNAEIEKAADTWCDALGLKNCPRVCVMHLDSDNIHCHVAVLRVDIETSKIAQMGDGWAKYASQLGVAQAEFENGWTNEPNAIFVTDPRGTFERITGLRVAETKGGADRNGLANARRERRKMQEEPLDLESTSLAFERKTGQYSDERIAKTMAKSRIQRAQNWQELHLSCASVGITYERSHTSGARLHFGDSQIAASASYANAALARLESRLGTFTPPPAGMVVRSFVRPVLEIIEDEEKQQRKLEKAQDKAEKEELKRQFEAMKRVVDQDYSHQQWASAKSKDNFKGKLARRKFIAEERRREANALLWCHIQIMERALWEKIHGPNENEMARALFWGDEDDRKIGFNARKIEQLTTDYKVDDAEDGWYFLNKYGHLAITISPNLIMQNLGCTDDDTRAALILAAARWDAVEVYGSQSHRKHTAILAGELGVRMSDPKLAEIAYNASVAAKKRYEAEQIKAQNIIADIGKHRAAQPEKSIIAHDAPHLSLAQMDELQWLRSLKEWRAARAMGATKAELAAIIDKSFDESFKQHIPRMEQLNKDELSAIRNNEKSRYHYLINTNPLRHTDMTDKEYRQAWKAATYNSKRASWGW